MKTIKGMGKTIINGIEKGKIQSKNRQKPMKGFGEIYAAAIRAEARSELIDIISDQLIASLDQSRTIDWNREAEIAYQKEILLTYL